MPSMAKTIETPLDGKLSHFGPLELKMVRHTPLEPLYNSLIHRYHYLGYRQIVGAHLKYLAFLNGFDPNCQRQCVSSQDVKLRHYSQSCPFFINYYGFIKHMSIKQYPRLITEVIRGTPRYQKLRSLRPASERLNSTAKEDLEILNKPRVRGRKRAAILGQLALISI